MNTNNIKQYRVGELSFRLVFKDTHNNESLIPSFQVFETELSDETLIFTLYVDDSFRPETKGNEIAEGQTTEYISLRMATTKYLYLM